MVSTLSFGRLQVQSQLVVAGGQRPELLAAVVTPLDLVTPLVTVGHRTAEGAHQQILSAADFAM